MGKTMDSDPGCSNSNSQSENKLKRRTEGNQQEEPPNKKPKGSVRYCWTCGAIDHLYKECPEFEAFMEKRKRTQVVGLIFRTK